MVPSCPSQARPCPARRSWADNFRRVVDGASRALILYDAATGPEGKFITAGSLAFSVSLERERVSFRAAARRVAHRDVAESPEVSRGRPGSRKGCGLP